MNKFYQVCYGKPNNNWESFNVSRDASAGIISFFERAANNNTPQNMDSTFVESGEDLFEIVSQDGYTEVSKVKYGMTDNFGRPMMFAHGFVFDSENKILENPNWVTCIDNSNFKFTYDETATPPETLTYSEEYSVENAMAVANIDGDQVYNLMAAVNLSLNSPSNYPTYIVYSGNETQKRALLYIVLSLIPYALRYQLSLSTTNNFKFSMNKSIMIVENATENEQYIDLINNSTNIELEKVQEESGEYPFYKALLKYTFHNYDEYCKTLLKVQTALNYNYLCEYEDLIIANHILSYLHVKQQKGILDFSKKSDIDITKFLLSFSAKAPLSNELVDEYIAALLFEYKNRKLVPNDILMTRIRVRNDKTSSEALKDIYKELQMIVLMQNGKEETIRFLDEEMKKGNGSFEEWVGYIIRSNGQNFINEFFELKITEAIDFNEVIELLNYYHQLVNGNIDASAVKNQLHDIALQKMRDNENVDNAFESTIEQYAKIYFDIFGDDEESTNIFNELIKDYWSNYSIDNFRFEQTYINNLKTVKDRNLEPAVISELCNLYHLILFVKEDDSNASRVDLESHFINLCKKYELSENTQNNLINFVISELEYQQTGHLVFWCNIASFNAEDLSDSKVISNLMKWNIKVFTSSHAFENSLKYSPRIDRKFVGNMIYAIQGSDVTTGYLKTVNSKSEEYELAKERLSELLKREREIDKEEKQRRKDERKRIQHVISSDYDNYDDYDNDDEGTDSDKQNKKKRGGIGSLFKRKD